MGNYFPLVFVLANLLGWTIALLWLANRPLFSRRESDEFSRSIDDWLARDNAYFNAHLEQMQREAAETTERQKRHLELLMKAAGLITPTDTLEGKFVDSPMLLEEPKPWRPNRK